uniref:Glabrous enhancer-binding protein-like DBD domain-containing protein n=1 Tax=Brassica campestris TaxID=3711 RepID=M4EH43_BRACM
MANNLKHPFEDPPSSSAGEEEIETEEEDQQHLHTIFSSEEDEPEDPPPRSVSKKRLSTNVSNSTNVAKKIYRQGGKMGTTNNNTPSFARVFSEKDEIVLLQGVIDSQVENPLKYKRSFYQSMKGSFSFDVTLVQFKDKIRNLKRKYKAKEKSGEQAASASNPHQQKCFQLSKAIWGADGIAFESKESERGLTKKRDLVTPGMGNNNAQEDMEKAPLVEKESTGWDDESSFFLGMDFLKEKWTKLPAESKKGTQEKMKKLHANELECQKYEEMLKVMKDKCARDKVELLNEVTSLIMAAD